MRHYHTTAGATERPDHPHRMFRGEEPERLYWNISDVAEMIGVENSSAIRFWEIQFGIDTAHRARNGYRKYVREEIERLRLIKRAVEYFHIAVAIELFRSGCLSIAVASIDSLVKKDVAIVDNTDSV